MIISNPSLAHAHDLTDPPSPSSSHSRSPLLISRSPRSTLPPLPPLTSTSAPTSPVSRPNMVNGLAPLSQVTPITLDRISQGGGRQSLAYPSSAPSPAAPSVGQRSGHPQSNGITQQQQQPSSLAANPNPSPNLSSNGASNGAGAGATHALVYLPDGRPVLVPASAAALGLKSKLPARLPGRGLGSVKTGGESSEEDTEWDSDATFVPHRSKHKHSHSQPDLTALRKNLEGWAGDVAQHQPPSASQQLQLLQQQQQPQVQLPSWGRRTSTGRKSPRASTVNLAFQQLHPQQPQQPAAPITAPPSPRNSRSSPSVATLRNLPSPRQVTTLVPPLTPVSPGQLSSSPDSSPALIFRQPLPSLSGAGATSTGDEADDDNDGTISSPSSGSLTFSPKTRMHALRRRIPSDREKDRERDRSRGLGLSLEGEVDLNDGTQAGQQGIAGLGLDAAQLPIILERRLQQSNLLSLRLLAIVPSVWGICVLAQALALGRWRVETWPWGVDFSIEAMETLISGGQVEGEWVQVERGDMVLAMAWVGFVAAITAQFCFHLTTGLTHRWRSYYSLPSTLTRLLSLQCLCWPATYITLWFLGVHRPLLCWVVIGVTTGWSRCVQMWVTSNVVPLDPGDITPGPSHSSLPGGRGKRRSSPRGSGLVPIVPPPGMTGWEAFTYGRRWDWDAVAREVGWKVGALLLVTTAWLFWGVEQGRWARA